MDTNRESAMLCLVTLLCPTLCDPMDCSLPGSSVYGDSSGKNTGVGCYALLQGIFPTQGLNPGLPHCRRILYRLSHQGNPSFIPTLYLPFMIWRLAISVTYEMRDICNWKVYSCLIIWRLTICAWVVFPDTEIDWQWVIHTNCFKPPASRSKCNPSLLHLCGWGLNWPCSCLATTDTTPLYPDV